MTKPFARGVNFTLAVIAVLCFTTGAWAKIEWEVLKKIKIEGEPLDIAVSSDAATVYILCSKNIQVYSTRANKITETIQVEGDFSQIAISSDGKKLFLTDTKSKQVSIIGISEVYNIDVGKSPVIGKADAPVSVFAFVDYQ